MGMAERPSISVVIPVYNGGATLRACLQATLSSSCEGFEVIVVDDGSRDDSTAIAASFPVTLIRMERRGGVSQARNRGADVSMADAIFFTDADCLMTDNTLATALETLRQNSGAVIGGTYTPLPADTGFFSHFQSILIHFFETKNPEPDYIAAHAMAIERGVFEKSGGFSRSPCLGLAAGIEDVEFSHRLRRSGHRLVMNPNIRVRHHFGFRLMGSLGNAWRRSLTWTRYSLANGDILEDSGAASRELKCNVACFLLCSGAAIACLGASPRLVPLLVFLMTASTVFNLAVNARVLRTFFQEGTSPAFAAGAVLYYLLVYPLPVGAGAAASLLAHLWKAARISLRL